VEEGEKLPLGLLDENVTVRVGEEPVTVATQFVDPSTANVGGAQFMEVVLVLEPLPPVTGVLDGVEVVPIQSAPKYEVQ
jgi:hypothetical protein